MPSQAQKNTTHFQVMIYKHLIEQTRKGAYREKDLIKELRINEDAVITKDFEEQLRNQGILKETKIKKLIKKIFEMIRKLPEIKEEYEIRYEEQHTRKEIGIDKFKHDEEWFKENCNFVEGFWNGEREAIPVGEGGKWKCKFCEYKDYCNT
jgi:hypothetical protein